MIFIYYKDFKKSNITQFGELAGQIQHMAAQKVGFTPRLLRQVVLAGKFKAQLHWNLHIRAELETYQLGPPALGACENRTIFGLRLPPLVYLTHTGVLTFKQMCLRKVWVLHATCWP
jgi:hypothetical protein